MRSRFVPFLIVVLAATSGLAAQAKKQEPKPQPKAPAPGAAAEAPKEEDPFAAELVAFRAWLQDYGSGAVRFVKEGKIDDAALAALDAHMQRVAKANTLAAAQLLFEAASVDPKPAGATEATELGDFHRELQPWRVQALASAQLRTMTGDGILPWL